MEQTVTLGELVEENQRLRMALQRACFLSMLLSGYDPEKHRHELMLDDAPVGNETHE